MKTTHVMREMSHKIIFLQLAISHGSTYILVNRLMLTRMYSHLTNKLILMFLSQLLVNKLVFYFFSKDRLVFYFINVFERLGKFLKYKNRGWGIRVQIN